MTSIDRISTALGSPPLARERHLPCHLAIHYIRITPAGAGKTDNQRCHWSPWKDHPRLRGKDVKNPRSLWIALGSPPLARERLKLQKILALALRITPACAGTTANILNFPFLVWDHPRLRGNDGSKPSSIAAVAGSPPLARERLLVCYEA